MRIQVIEPRNTITDLPKVTPFGSSCGVPHCVSSSYSFVVPPHTRFVHLIHHFLWRVHAIIVLLSDTEKHNEISKSFVSIMFVHQVQGST